MDSLAWEKKKTDKHRCARSPTFGLYIHAQNRITAGENIQPIKNAS